MSVSSVVRLHPLALAVLALMAAPVGAQTAPEKKTEADEGALEKVVVTARKREETLQDSPVAVTALTAQSLDRLNIKNLGDLQGNVPSLTVYAARGSNSTITTFIRGVGQADPLWGVDPGVGIYLDDVYMARPQGALLEVFDVQRIEVLRGPQGTLYGKNTIGGAVKYVSRPLGTKTEGVASLTLGDYGQRQFKAALGGGTDSGEWRGRVAVAKAQRDGFGKNLTDGTDVSNQDTEAARVQLGWFPSSLPLSVQFAADRTNDHSNMRGFQRMATNKFIANDVLDPSRYDIASGMPNANMTEAGGHAWTVNFDLGKDWSGKFISSYRSSDTDTSIDFDGRPNKVADVRAFYSDHARSHELQFTRAGGGVIGLYRFEGQAGGQVRNNFFNLSFGDTRGEVYTSSTAAYADWDWELTSALTLSAGLRATREEKRAVVLNRAYSDATFTTPTATVSNFDKTRTVNNTSPKLSLGYELSRDTKLYATASRGFKSGGYNIRANVTAVPSSSKPFEDETLDSLEVGAKMLFDQGRLELNAAAFHNNYKNVQLSVFTSYTQANGQPGFFGDFTNAGKATVNGLELEWIWRPTRNWTFKGNAAVLDAKYDEYLDKGVNIADQKKFSNTPKVSGAMDVEYRTAFPLGGEVRTRVGVSYRSKVYPTTDLSEVIAQTGYALWSAGVIWERDRNWTFALQGSNLSDKAYRTDGYNIPALGVLNGFYGAPRQVSFTTTYRF
ncbi:TonB-dependent receptor [Inhella gelatinilytica]|uniref:TonB-dependent receptor n=1 Tax=Inhella gelatinilytica TaxID=2795030 RepID=A0A931IVA2_9BURK|nr:TonB-dependent receptor [Inhella gelatinilytica]MBH9553435.1 TonB-dependent receptor [Inhella gelatinilytica]